MLDGKIGASAPGVNDDVNLNGVELITLVGVEFITFAGLTTKCSAPD